jgi:hypothetical protein
MSIYGQYFVVNLCREAGWPRTTGLFLKKSVIDTVIFDGAIDQMINWAASLGAGRPKLALQMIAEMFRNRDWSGDNAPSILEFIEAARNGLQAWSSRDPVAPQDVVERPSFTRLGKTIGAEKLTDPQMRMALEQFCLQGILWGLANPGLFAEWYDGYWQDADGSLALAKAAGVDSEHPKPIEEMFEDSEKILRNYERDIGSLPSIPERLALEFTSLGRGALM